MTDRHWTLDPEIDAFLHTMPPPPEEMMERLMRERAPIEQSAPKPGDRAPDFEAEWLSRDGERTGKTVRRADLEGQPVALLFGNCTCPVYRGQIARFNEIYRELGGYFQFVNIYTREAHPADGWRLEINDRQGFEYTQPRTIDERADIVRACQARHKIELPTALDTMDDKIEKLYSGVPDRVYIIDERGIGTHRSERGPFDMTAIESWHAALKKKVGADVS